MRYEHYTAPWLTNKQVDAGWEHQESYGSPFVARRCTKWVLGAGPLTPVL
jgi:hypothetical protein